MSQDTIAAIATAPGEGGIGVIRVSGPEAFSVGRRVFVSGSGNDPKPRVLTYGHIQDPDNGDTIDEVLCVFLPGPHTYTTEDTVEIDCHGGMVPLRKTLELLLRQGARTAERGEFTKRAFLGGRLDLSQAEAVMDLISAKADRSYASALDQLNGSVSRKIREIRARLVDVLVDLTVNIDYPDEDIEELTYQKLSDALMEISGSVDDLRESCETGRILREGLRVSIIGKPNVGKSSLMNALLGQARAIVTDIPGTTRDTIEESLHIRGIPVVLTDTAGIRDTEDQVESMGIERSRDAFLHADLVLWMLDGSRPLSEEDLSIREQLDSARTLVILNKTDLPQAVSVEEAENLFEGAKVIATCMKEANGLSLIEDAIEHRVISGQAAASGDVLITNARHKSLLDQTAASLADAGAAVSAGEPLELIEIDVNAAYVLLGQIIGEAVEDDILNAVFERFCLGK